ncbi:class I SAM-dependent methyltransferase [Candidatus Neomarinimicrobiota bacterium]
MTGRDQSSRIACGRPANYDDEIIQRRDRLTREWVSPAGKRVIDLGCGNGAQSSRFCDKAKWIIGLDVQREGLEYWAAQLASAHLATGLPVRYDGFLMPLGDESADLAVSYDVLEHVVDEEAVLAELWRVLRQDGDLVLSVPNKWWIFETHGSHLPLLPWHRVPFLSWLPKFLHKKFARARNYRKKEIIDLLGECGFHVVDILYITAPLDAVKLPWLKRMLRTTIFRGDTTWLPFLATAILVHGKKGG